MGKVDLDFSRKWHSTDEFDAMIRRSCHSLVGCLISLIDGSDHKFSDCNRYVAFTKKMSTFHDRPVTPHDRRGYDYHSYYLILLN